jgi:CheY-like chemotaxis protein
LAEANNFGDLVNDAFIKPLRSVLIVDDEYPTWEEVLNDRLSDSDQNRTLAQYSASKVKKENSKRLLDIISRFRSCDPGLVIDLHDPMAPAFKEDDTAQGLASHLHQSDLLILDYNLEGEAGRLGGIKAREILKAVLSNNHFNLVVVHTGEEDLEVLAKAVPAGFA